MPFYITFPVSQFSSVRRLFYGPFDTEEAAGEFLREHGWIYTNDPTREIHTVWGREPGTGEGWYKRDPLFVRPKPQPDDKFYPRDPGFFAHSWLVEQHEWDDSYTCQVVRPPSNIPEDELYPEVYRIRKTVEELESEVGQKDARIKKACDEATAKVEAEVTKQEQELQWLRQQLNAFKK